MKQKKRNRILNLLILISKSCPSQPGSIHLNSIVHLKSITFGWRRVIVLSGWDVAHSQDCPLSRRSIPIEVTVRNISRNVDGFGAKRTGFVHADVEPGQFLRHADPGAGLADQ